MRDEPTQNGGFHVTVDGAAFDAGVVSYLFEELYV